MRRFPAPWTVEQIPGGYKVVDATGQAIAYCYGRETKADADIAKTLTMDEARRIAANIAKLPAQSDYAAGSAARRNGSATSVRVADKRGAQRVALGPNKCRNPDGHIHNHSRSLDRRSRKRDSHHNIWDKLGHMRSRGNQHRSLGNQDRCRC
jgi:hypothetical protein